MPQSDDDPCDFINHSDDPTLLYHCGLGFARRNMTRGEEITCDYRFFDTEHSDNFIDILTGQKLLKKRPAKDLLVASATELLQLLG